MVELTARLGRRIRQLRQLRHLTQEELAERANLNVTFVSQIERGCKSPTVETIGKIANGLQVSLPELFCFDEQQPASANDQRLRELLLEYSDKIRALYQER